MMAERAPNHVRHYRREQYLVGPQLKAPDAHGEKDIEAGRYHADQQGDPAKVHLQSGELEKTAPAGANARQHGLILSTRPHHHGIPSQAAKGLLLLACNACSYTARYFRLTAGELN